MKRLKPRLSKNNLSIGFLVAGLAWLLGAATAPLATQSHTQVEGSVIDTYTRQPISAAVVKITNGNLSVSDTTDALGRFTLSLIPGDGYTLLVRGAAHKLMILADLSAPSDLGAQLEKPIELIPLAGPPAEYRLEAEEMRDMSLDMPSLGSGARTKAAKATSSVAAMQGASVQQALRPMHPAPMPMAPFNTEEYAHIQSNGFQRVLDHPLSTFASDVDAASYSNARRFLMGGSLPPKDAVRIEEFVNYFDYPYAQPKGKHPLSLHLEYGPCPWNSDNRLIHIGLQGKSLERDESRPSNLVFLLDVSGSMNSPDKLPLLKKAFRLLVDQLGRDDRVAIAVYAGAAGLVLEPTAGSDKETILAAIDKLSAGGSTAGGQGIELAYKVAEESWRKNGNNRVILATDGDFNVGVSSSGALVRLIEKKREKGIFLTVLGFGSGNLKDNKMEQLADKGNGHYAYIDNLLEAKKVLVNEVGATLHTIAKDAKIQVEFNPAHVAAYRLVGYENRLLQDEDFADDRKDAGDIGAGHGVTAIYEVVPAAGYDERELKYLKTRIKESAGQSDEVLTVRIRYKDPDKEKSQLFERSLKGDPTGLSSTSETFRFSAAVAQFAMLLRDSEHRGAANFVNTAKLAREARGADHYGYRAEFVRLVEIAQLLQPVAALDD